MKFNEFEKKAVNYTKEFKYTLKFRLRVKYRIINIKI